MKLNPVDFCRHQKIVLRRFGQTQMHPTKRAWLYPGLSDPEAKQTAEACTLSSIWSIGLDVAMRETMADADEDDPMHLQ